MLRADLGRVTPVRLFWFGRRFALWFDRYRGEILKPERQLPGTGIELLCA